MLGFRACVNRCGLGRIIQTGEFTRKPHLRLRGWKLRCNEASLSRTFIFAIQIPDRPSRAVGRLNEVSVHATPHTKNKHIVNLYHVKQADYCTSSNHLTVANFDHEAYRQHRQYELTYFVIFDI